MPSKLVIRVRKIALRNENVVCRFANAAPHTGPDAAAVRRAVDACPARLTRVVVGGYDVTQWYVAQPSPTSSTSSASTVTSLHGPGDFRSASEPFPPGWLDEPPTPPTPVAVLHPLTQL